MLGLRVARVAQAPSVPRCSGDSSSRPATRCPTTPPTSSAAPRVRCSRSRSSCPSCGRWSIGSSRPPEHDRVRVSQARVRRICHPHVDRRARWLPRGCVSFCGRIALMPTPPTPSPTPTPSQPVFLDPHGRRARGWRRLWIVVGAVAMAMAALLIVGVAIPPLVPSLPIDHQLLPPGGVHPRPARAPRDPPEPRARLPPRHRPRGTDALAPPGGSALVARRGTATNPIVAGFFVNWADNSLASLIQHVNDLDWVMCEWSFLSPAGDSIDFEINRRVFDVVRKPACPDAAGDPAHGQQLRPAHDGTDGEAVQCPCTARRSCARRKRARERRDSSAMKWCATPSPASPSISRTSPRISAARRCSSRRPSASPSPRSSASSRPPCHPIPRPASCSGSRR